MSTRLGRNRVQCVVDVADGPNAQFMDKKTGQSPIIWDNADVELAFAFYWNDALIDISNIASVTLTATDNAGDDDTLILPERTITFSELPGFPDAKLDASLDDTSWSENTKQHALFPFTATEMNILTDGTEMDLWVVLTAVTTTGETWILGYSVVKVKDSRRVAAGAPTPNAPDYLTRAESIALFAAKNEALAQVQSVKIWNAEQGRYVEFICVGAAGQESLAPQSGGA